MTTVFIGGSRKISRLNDEVRGRLDAIIDKNLAVVVGDASGADRAVQRHLADKQYTHVTVFCMTGDCRNNVGKWNTHEVSAPTGARGFAYYAAKDRAMADTASHGLMLWDGQSKGTMNNIVTMTRQQKPVVVYFAPAKAFHTVRCSADVLTLLDSCDDSAVREFDLVRA